MVNGTELEYIVYVYIYIYSDFIISLRFPL